MINKEIQQNLREFEQIKNEVVEIIGAFPEKSRSKILFGEWSLKDVVAHLSNWIEHDKGCLEKLKMGQEPKWEPDFDEFNMKGVEARKGWSWQKVFDEFLILNEELYKLYYSLPENLWDKPIWKGYGLTARKFILKDIEHKNDHLEELRKYLLSDTVTQ